MCNEIWNLFLACRCRVFQNTFPCHTARRCGSNDDMLLAKTVFLPAERPKLPPGLLDCMRRKATRPVSGFCPECKRKQAMEKRTVTPSKTETPASTPSSGLSVESGSFGRGNKVIGSIARMRLDVTPSPDAEAINAVRRSFQRFSMLQQPTPEKENSEGGRMGGVEHTPLASDIAEDRLFS